MTKIDMTKFHEALQEAGSWQGKRCNAARNNDEGDIVAAATAMSLLATLRNLAHHKLLSHKDIQQAIDAFMEASAMKEVEQPMGGTVFVRKVAA